MAPEQGGWPCGVNPPELEGRADPGHGAVGWPGRGQKRGHLELVHHSGQSLGCVHVSLPALWEGPDVYIPV